SAADRATAAAVARTNLLMVCFLDYGSVLVGRRTMLIVRADASALRVLGKEVFQVIEQPAKYSRAKQLIHHISV
ncbi:MAG: hypothetical protein AAFR23_03995, partial [Pseudomonadota bacterium]